MSSLDRTPKVNSPRDLMRAAEKAAAARRRGFLGDDFVVVTNASATVVETKRSLK